MGSGPHSPQLTAFQLRGLDRISDDDEYDPSYMAPSSTDEPDSSSVRFVLDEGLEEGRAQQDEAGKPQDGEEDVDTPRHSHQQTLLDRDVQRKTTFYDYAAEKQLSHSDAKFFYQRRREPSSTQGDGYGPIQRAHTVSAVLSDGTGRSSRAGSIQSRASQPSFARYDDVRSQRPNDAAELRSRSNAPQESSGGWEGFGRAQGVGADSATPARTIQNEGSSTADAVPFGPPQEPGSSFGPATSNSGLGTRQSADGGEAAFGSADPQVMSELSAIYSNIQRVLDIRRNYIRSSLQGPGDNPKDDPDWKIYPPPPKPVWDEDKERTSDRGGVHHEQDEKAPANVVKSTDASAATAVPSRCREHKGAAEQKHSRVRKQGENIGEDFKMSDLLPLPEASEMTYRMDKSGVYQVYENAEAEELDSPIISVPTIRNYYMDLDQLLNISSDGPSKSFAFRRLQYLEGRFNLYSLTHGYQEMTDSKRVPHRDFYNVRKVDTHVHHSACMNQKHLLRFIKSKMKRCPDEVVLFRDGKHLTLEQVFRSLNLTAYDLSIDTLDMHAHTDSFHRFDKFNLKYNPIGESRLRTIFLKTDNLIQGRYLAEISREVISDLESSKYQMVEWRISIYGRSLDEWDKLAAWVVDHKLFSHNVRWLIQVPRLYDVFKSSQIVDNFEQVVSNLFRPLFEVTRDPRSHPKLHVFLQRVIGFDSVDDESKAERRIYRKFPLPQAWNTMQNPPYSYWIYYLYGNMTSLNAWRKQRGFNTFVLRPHCGEAGDPDHLAAAVLCCHSISHGLLLRKVPLLQYVFYLEQIGIAMSPLSNNALFLAYDRNPFLQYYKRGLNVSLSTDDPLQFAFTKEPLIEEYSVAAQIYKLNGVDMCELARNSVLQSGFEAVVKQQWLGPDWHRPGPAGNTMAKSNVPDMRVAYRHRTLMEELLMVERYRVSSSSAAPDLVDPSLRPSSANVPPSPAISARAATAPASTHADGSQVQAHAASAPERPLTPAAWSAPTESMGTLQLTTSAEALCFPGVVTQMAGRSQLRGSGSGSGSGSVIPRSRPSDGIAGITTNSSPFDGCVDDDDDDDAADGGAHGHDETVRGGA
ncbi:MAG: AMP deaminase [Phylliscum demangeonii]|nr:MAG: AMP deaminase [Phylliscum demangeonii]